MRVAIVPRTRSGRIRMLVLASLLPMLFLLIWFFTVRMPGPAFTGPLPPLTPNQDAMRTALEGHVRFLAHTIGARGRQDWTNVYRAAAYIERTLKDLGYQVVSHEFEAYNRPYRNIEATLPGVNRPQEVVILGAHYDTAEDAPGADDNASGVAGVLELARVFAAERQSRTIRFVFFPNEEPPSFPTANMGSRHYATAARARNDQIVAMLSIESIGYFDTEKGSQRYPFPLNLAYPDVGDFIGFVSNLSSRPLLVQAISAFRAHATLPTQGAAAPSWVPGVWWSDHWAFWREGYPAIMITDTAPYRNPFYHTTEDTADKLDFGRMARVVHGLTHVVRAIAN
ncbi:MAG TPA: M20/M25/M40 family metallo-hydrolase [Gemmatimonadales bacterium]|nr:M20/M25/M40 family metallo-hydrolase [Gemmatimonadales bacterium]